ncbi:unnamed protein product [Cylicocyclus nassatus]|uniref:Large ribosomal subunit protein P2 n=1 Tax=Cylicocyclus nassatus TaxID=53992 RepID=A0AA36M5K0_CYLNA|nr:unnamed protein product [Cylicocyclus nassatus]
MLLEFFALGILACSALGQGILTPQELVNALPKPADLFDFKIPGSGNVHGAKGQKGAEMGMSDQIRPESSKGAATKPPGSESRVPGKMHYVSAYLFALAGGSELPKLEDLENILGAVGVDIDVEAAKLVISRLEGTSIGEVIT